MLQQATDGVILYNAAHREQISGNGTHCEPETTNVEYINTTRAENEFRRSQGEHRNNRGNVEHVQCQVMPVSFNSNLALKSAYPIPNICIEMILISPLHIEEKFTRQCPLNTEEVKFSLIKYKHLLTMYLRTCMHQLTSCHYFN